MKVRLIDVDGKYPNLALMRISQYHKDNNDDVDWYNPLFDTDCDKIYASKLFDFSPNPNIPANCEIIKGGTGYDIKSKLPEEIDEYRKLDYSLYKSDISIQFFSRGCNNTCPFCVVPKKEGRTHLVEPFELNPYGNKIYVFDNNFFQNEEWEKASQYLIKTKQPVNFFGIQADTIYKKQADFLNTIKLDKAIYIAWDNPKKDMIPVFLRILNFIKAYKICVYVLIGYWSTKEEDLYRVSEINRLGMRPFVMPFDKNDTYQKKFTRWVNHRAVFKSCTFQEYIK